MTTAYTSLLGLALPVTGELSGSWGDTVNTAITSLLDTAVAGTTSITTDADITLTTTTGASNQARQAIILWNPASGTVTRNITAPAQSKMYTVINASGGTQSIVIRGAGPTTGVTIVKGESAVVAWNGSDFVKISNAGGAGTFTNLTVTGNTILGDASADTVTVNGTITSNLIFTDNTYDIGASGATRPRNLYLAGDATIGGSIAATTLDLTNLEVTNIKAKDGTAAMTIADSTGAVAVSTNMTIGNATSDTLTVTSTITSNLLFTDNTYDIGASGATRPRTGYFGTSVITPALTVSGLADGRVTYASTGGLLVDSANLTFNSQNLTVTNSASATGPTVSSYALQAAGGNNLIANLNANGELYAANTASSKYQYFQAGTLMSIVANDAGVNTAALIDFHATNAAVGATNLFLGAIAGPSANGAATFVLGRRTGTSTWAESLRVDTAGALVTTPDAGSTTVFNENGVDADFRVESDTDTHMLFVDAGTNTVNIGGTPPTYPGRLNVGGGGIFSNATSFDPDLADNGTILLGNINDGGGFSAPGIGWKNSGTGNTAAVVAAGNTLYLGTGDASTANSLTARLNLSHLESVFNENGFDVDFRVESDTNTHALFVDAGNSRVSINTSDTANATFTVAGPGTSTATTAFFANVDGTYNPYLQIQNLGSSGMKLLQSSSYGGSASRLNIEVAGVNCLNMMPTEVSINDGSADMDFRVESNNNTHMLLVDAGANAVCVAQNGPSFNSTLSVNGLSNSNNFFTGFVPDSVNNATGALLLWNLTAGSAATAGYQWTGTIVTNSYTGSSAWCGTIVAYYSNQSITSYTAWALTGQTRVRLDLVTLSYAGANYLAILKNGGGGTGTLNIDGFHASNTNVREIQSGSFTVTTTHTTLV